MINTTTSSSKPGACWNWSRILLSACLPLVLGVFTIVFTIQQNSISIANRGQDRRQAIELRQQVIRSNRQQLNYIGFKTIDVLRHLSKIQKRDVILFLYNHELIRSDKPESQRVILKGADLTDVHFIQSNSMNCDLRNISLMSVLASNMVFERCDISYVAFDNAYMVGAKFIGSQMEDVRFHKANLTDVVFDGSNVYKVNFFHAILINSKFLGIKPVSADFTNADLLNSDLTSKDISAITHTFLNTRYPNGSFSVVNNTQLINDGGAELICIDNRLKDWQVFKPNQSLYFYNKNHLNFGLSEQIIDNCSFYKNSRGIMYQYISETQYLLLINNEIAYFNLSALMGCVIHNRSNDRALIDVRCFDEYHDGPVCGGISIKKP
ncbi:unnamed protein product [Adineta steineri]|uniref:Pentapeptide repeat-containing protein n=1 Tax=Adineta steineri TaxID=433720 RepID=A0A818YTP8_9BILA|nr:unnamed protein product [Adineta steineri]